MRFVKPRAFLLPKIEAKILQSIIGAFMSDYNSRISRFAGRDDAWTEKVDGLLQKIPASDEKISSLQQRIESETNPVRLAKLEAQLVTAEQKSAKDEARLEQWQGKSAEVTERAERVIALEVEKIATTIERAINSGDPIPEATLALMVEDFALAVTRGEVPSP